MNSNEVNQIKSDYQKVVNSIEEFDIINIQRKELINKRYELNNLILLKQKLENDKTGVSILLVPIYMHKNSNIKSDKKVFVKTFKKRDFSDIDI